MPNFNNYDQDRASRIAREEARQDALNYLKNAEDALSRANVKYNLAMKEANKALVRLETARDDLTQARKNYERI
jgi:hypothetical protein